jgi:hypothetical protein
MSALSTATFSDVEEAQSVIERLARIEELKRRGALPLEILSEIRSLLAEGEAWLAAERAGAEQVETARAEEALDSCRARLASSQIGERREVRAGTAL